MKGLRASIYRDNYRSPFCSLGMVERVTVVGIDGAEIFEVADDAPAVRLVRRNVFGRDIVHVEPVDKPAGHGGCLGPMFGGAYVATSDSRFGAATGIYGAVALHDLFERSSGGGE